MSSPGCRPGSRHRPRWRTEAARFLSAASRPRQHWAKPGQNKFRAGQRDGRICTTEDAKNKPRRAAVASLRLSVPAVVTCLGWRGALSPGGGSVELGVHDARVPGRGRTQPARGRRIQAAALGEVPWSPVHPVVTPWTGRAGPHAGEANSDLAPGRGGSGGGRVASSRAPWGGGKRHGTEEPTVKVADARVSWGSGGRGGRP